MTNRPLCIFHAHCDDGFAAAWCVRHALAPHGNVEFHPGVYGQDPPDVTGRDVILVDFSYKRPVIDAMIAKASSLLILDHHKTAAADLAGLPGAGVNLGEWSTRDFKVGDCNVGVLFDMARSGAGIAWDFFHNHDPRPDFIDYIEDRDLWKKELPGGDQFTIALRSYEQDFEIWDRLLRRGAQRLIEEGGPIWRYYEQRIKEMAAQAYLATIMVLAENPEDDDDIRELRVMIANAPYFAASELAGELAKVDGAQFGACFFQRADGLWQYSLRSRGDFDVSKVAQVFGGGGHKSAAGFQVKEPVHTAAAAGE